MNKMNTQMIARQLSALANGVSALEGEELTFALLDVCAELLNAANVQGELLLDSGACELDELLVAYSNVSEGVSSFVSNKIKDTTKETALLDDVVARYAENKQRAQQLEADLEQKQQLNKALEAKVEEMNRESHDLVLIETALQNQLSVLTPESLEEKKSRNVSLLTELGNRQKSEQDLEDEFKRVSKELKGKEAEIVSLQKKIDAVSEQDKQLHKEYTKLKCHLEELQQAQVNCSKEEQQTLKDRISELTPVVEKLKADWETLNATCEELKGHQIEYDRHRQLVYTDLKEHIDGTLKTMSSIALEYRDALEVVKKQADTVYNNLAECAELRTQYAAWFDADRPPLEEMLRVFRRDEHAKLREVLDIRQSDRVCELFDQTRLNLQELDNILKKCHKATSADQRILEGRTFGK